MPAPKPMARDQGFAAERSGSPITHPGEPLERRSKLNRAGLATSFGESIESQMDYTSFERGFLAKPYAVGSAHYNDHEGALAMAHQLGRPVTLEGGMITTAKGTVDWGLKDAKGRFLDGYLVGEKVIFKGTRGDRYVIVVRNNTRQPLEFVMSVDGLDVIDGNPAKYSKRGYVVGPKRTLEVRGFRTSTDRVAAFRFGAVSDSYAALRHGDTRNVGVIGVAVFTEKGNKNPWRLLESETQRREEANPFPGRFSLPPH